MLCTLNPRIKMRENAPSLLVKHDFKQYAVIVAAAVVSILRIVSLVLPEEPQSLSLPSLVVLSALQVSTIGFS